MSDQALTESLQDQLIDLQTRVAYQDDILETFNSELVKQSKEIEILQKQLVFLKDSIQQTPEGNDSVLDERPPHY